MGKYSLENYERYSMIKCRPLEKAELIEGAGKSTFETVTIALDEDLPKLTAKTLLQIHTGKVTLDNITEVEYKIRKIASGYYEDPLLLGVSIVADAFVKLKHRLWSTTAEAFKHKRFYVSLHDSEQLDYCIKHGIARGLLVEVGENVYDTCEAFALNNAQQLYKIMPVLVRMPKNRTELSQYVQQWHSMAVEGIETLAGWRIALRRLNYPKKLSSGGYVPMRFWWTNKGPSLCHEETEIRLRIEKDGKYTPICLNDKPHCIHLADRVHNEILRLPEVDPGIYQLEYGIFTKNGEALVLASEGACGDGYYKADKMEIDTTPRPQYQNIWDDYFVDGYYPLEDPKQPN